MDPNLLRKEAESSVNYYNNFISKKDRPDIVQDIILRVLETDKIEKDKNWVKIVAKAVIVDHIRKKDRRKTLTSECIEVGRAPVAKDLLLSIALNCSELEYEVAKLVSLGYTYQDIAEMLGKKGKSFTYAVLKRIAKKLEEDQSGQKI